MKICFFFRIGIKFFKPIVWPSRARFFLQDREVKMYLCVVLYKEEG